MRSTPVLLGLLAALLLAVALPSAAPAAGKGDKHECQERKGKRKPPPKGGCSASDDDGGEGHPWWERRWRVVDVALKGTTTMRYEQDDKKYVVDGTTEYTMPQPGGAFDLRDKLAVQAGLWSVSIKGVLVRMSSSARYTDDTTNMDCSFTPPISATPPALAGAVSIKRANEISVQWSLAPTMQKCPGSLDRFWRGGAPTAMSTSIHRLGDHFGATKVLTVDIDQTVREEAGFYRQTWKGTITLKTERDQT